MKYILLLLLSFNTYALSEKEHQRVNCKGEMEVKIKGGRIDCLTELYAVEYDFAYKWKNAISQSRWYALQTGKRAGIALIYRKPSDETYLEYLIEYLHGYDIYIRVWIVKDY